MPHIVYKVETERETDGRWIAEVVGLPGVLAYGTTESEAIASAQALALRVLADRIEEQKDSADSVTVSIEAA
jgi:predicted RNase H-like HicB family nuclease